LLGGTEVLPDCKPFDPGWIAENTYGVVSEEMIKVLQESIAAVANVPKKVYAQHVYKDGRIKVKDTWMKVENILLDSGATHASYIDTNYLAKFRDQVQKHIREIKAQVTLADNKTKLTITEVITLTLELPYEDCTVIAADMDMPASGHAWKNYDNWFTRFN
jgi:hypothetical protein